MNFSLELSDYWALSLVHASCKLQSGYENYSLPYREQGKLLNYWTLWCIKG